LDHIFGVSRRKENFFPLSRYPTALIVFSVIMEQLENSPIKRKKKRQKKRRQFPVPAWGINAISLTAFLTVVTSSG